MPNTRRGVWHAIGSHGNIQHFQVFIFAGLLLVQFSRASPNPNKSAIGHNEIKYLMSILRNHSIFNALIRGLQLSCSPKLKLLCQLLCRESPLTPACCKSTSPSGRDELQSINTETALEVTRKVSLAIDFYIPPVLYYSNSAFKGLLGVY